MHLGRGLSEDFCELLFFLRSSPTMPPPTHEVYRLLTKLSSVNSLWTFRIFDDDTVQIEIESEGDSPTGQALTTAPTVREMDQHLDVSDLLVGSGEHVVTRDRDLCQCEVFLVKREYPHAVQYMVYSLSSTLGVLCETNFGTVSSRGRPACMTFGRVDVALNHPAAWSVAVEPVRATLYPLSCGSYTLKGVFMFLDFRLYSPMILYIELLPGGQVAGTGFDSGLHADASKVDLTGSWTMDSLEVFQDVFESQWQPDHLRLRLLGPVTQYVFQAWWQHEDEVFVDSDERIAGQVGFADLRVTSMRRHWTPDVHHLFPAQFHEAVRWCLLSSLRPGKQSISTELWRNVLDFCDSHWFI